MASFAQYNPVNALRRAKDFELAGDKDKALEHLYEVLVSKKMGRQWQPAHEAAVMKFVDLCVEFRESRKCKEGLYYYRNLASQQNPQSLDKVIVHLIDFSMKKAAEARARTDNVAGLETVEDLEAEEQSPESLLMGGVTSEGSRDRAEREILVPWVRHMWDTYRNVLETLRNNPVLEHLYHLVAYRAMGFCKQYNRATEFRKLCGTLRSHWTNQRQHAELNDRELSQETVERHMATRFSQLQHCSEMALWNEGFRTIHDIHEMMEDTNIVPRQQVMATYYERLARIFWVSENYLFHAYSWSRFASLLLARNASLEEDDRRNLATAVMLAAVSIPIYSAGPAGSGASYNTSQAVDPLSGDADRKKKNDLAKLLRTPQQQQQQGILSALPTREALLNELAAKRMLSIVKPEAAMLFRLLEGEFSPLTLVARAQPLLAWVNEQKGPTVPAHVQIIGGSTAGGAHTMAQYVPNLERLLVFRLLEQLSAVYSTVLISNFQGLISGLRMSFFDVEKLAVRAMKQRQLGIRIDHRAGIIRLLSSDTQETTATRRQLTTLASRLQTVVDELQPQLAEGAVVPLEKREQVFHFARIHSEGHRREMHRRHIVVRQRRENAMRAIEQQAKVHQDEFMKQKEQQAKIEADRISKEIQEREAAARKIIDDQIKKDAIEKLLKKANDAHVDIGKLGAAQELDEEALQRVLNEQLVKARDDELKRRSEQGRRVDYLIRALREAERPKVEASVKATVEAHAAYVSKYNQTKHDELKAKFDAALAVKGKITKIVPYAAKFEQEFMAKRVQAYEKQKAANEEILKLQFLQKKIEKARVNRAADEKRLADEKARSAQAEEEDKKRSEAEAKRIEQESRVRAAEESLAAENASKQSSAVWRPKGRSEGGVGGSAGGAPSASSSSSSSSSSSAVRPPIFNTGAADGGWRAKQAARQSGGGDPLPPVLTSPAPGSNGARVGGGGGGEGSGMRSWDRSDSSGGGGGGRPGGGQSWGR